MRQRYGSWVWQVEVIGHLDRHCLAGCGNELKEDKTGLSSGGEDVKTVAKDNVLKKFDHEGEQSSEMRMEGILHLQCSF